MKSTVLASNKTWNVDAIAARRAQVPRRWPVITESANHWFEVLSITKWRFGASADAFHPTRFVNISKTWRRKIEALRAYDHEMRAFPHSRSYQAVGALARLRGATTGRKTAEAFTAYREIVPCTR